MSVFFTADTHFGHANIMKFCRRPGLSKTEQEMLDNHEDFRVSRESVERMDDYLIAGINNLVEEEDTLWHLGDFCFAPKHEYFNAARKYRNQIKCKNVHIIWGNHDTYSIAPLFSSAKVYDGINVEHQNIILLHYAMAVWNKSHRGTWQLYGHSHANAELWLDRVMAGRRSFDVGVDNAALILGDYRPWSFEEVKKIMDKRNGYSIDHHGRSNED